MVADSGSGPVLKRGVVEVEMSCRGGQGRSNMPMAPKAGSCPVLKNKHQVRRLFRRFRVLEADFVPAHMQIVTVQGKHK